MQRAISLIERLCDIAAPRNYLAETREYLVNAGIAAAVASHDTPALYRIAALDILGDVISARCSALIRLTSVQG